MFASTAVGAAVYLKGLGITILLFSFRSYVTQFTSIMADIVYKEFMLSAIGRNINKYCRFLNEKLKKFEGKTTEKTA